ncbi:hypothetical protein GCM10010129_79670 [Streptomyces fumigatiscleroticus]|nr:hypothetical protein GCM10010129_79670 [Streptomyces fumigatiscleroticus]
MTPSHIDQALEGVNLYWQPGTSCSSCDVIQGGWKSPSGGADDGHWSSGEEGTAAAQSVTTAVKWTGTGKETIDLSWELRGQVDISELSTEANFGTSGTDGSRELAPRCDDILSGVAPGCVLPYFSPTYTVDTNLNPAAGAYYWLMQQKMPNRPGTGDEPLHYLGMDTAVINPDTGEPWTSSDSRGVVCPDGWAKHPSDASLGTLSCDEFTMASTHESGGFPGPYRVDSGNKCAQLYADKRGTGSNFGLFADTRTATNGPAWTETCGRASIPDVQNSGAFKYLQPSVWRLLDNDEFYVSNPPRTPSCHGRHGDEPARPYSRARCDGTARLPEPSPAYRTPPQSGGIRRKHASGAPASDRPPGHGRHRGRFSPEPQLTCRKRRDKSQPCSGSRTDIPTDLDELLVSARERRPTASWSVRSAIRHHHPSGRPFGQRFGRDMPSRMPVHFLALEKNPAWSRPRRYAAPWTLFRSMWPTRLRFGVRSQKSPSSRNSSSVSSSVCTRSPSLSLNHRSARSAVPSVFLSISSRPVSDSILLRRL